MIKGTEKESVPSQFIDIVTLANEMKVNTIPDVRFIIHVEEKVNYKDIGINVNVKSGVSCYKAKLYYGQFNKQILPMYFQNKDRGIQILSQMNIVHFLFGSIYVFIKDEDYLAHKGQYLIEAGGRLSTIKNKKCTFVLTKWGKIGDYFEIVGAVVPEKKFTVEIRGIDKPLIEKTYREHRIYYPTDPKSISSLQEAGVETEYVRAARVETVKVDGDYEPVKLGELGVSGANKRYGGIIAPERPEGAKSIVPTLVSNDSSNDNGNRVLDINRKEFLEIKEEIFEKYNDLVDIQEAINNYVLEVVKESEEDWYEHYILLLGRTLKENWFRKPEENKGYDGRSLFKYVLEDILIEDDFKPIWDMFSHTTDIVDKWIYDSMTGVLAPLSPVRKKILYKLIEKILGLSCDLYVVDLNCMTLNRTIFDFIKYAPYRLGLITNISLKDMDKLAILGGLFCNSKSNNDRSIAYYHDYLSDYNQMNGSTIMLEQKARTLKPGYYINGSEFMRMSNYVNAQPFGIYFDDNIRVNIKTYFDIGESAMYVPKHGWAASFGQNSTYYLQTSTSSSLDDYLRSNIGVKLNIDKTYVSDFSVYKKEISIYHNLYSFDFPLHSIDVDEYIKRFELSQGRNFKLEQRQKDAIKNCFIPENSVYTTTGGAGSGKTTLISGILYVYMMGYGYDKEDIIMVAPTGKAATQITEKTGFEAKTIHSQFKIGLPYDIDEFKAKVVIIDECSMINLDLMYQLLNRIPKECRVIMSGDINQLEPIGFGQPFADSLNFTPIVTLNVMKRAEAGSAINRNAKRMIEGYEKLDQGDDFIIINEPNYKKEIRVQIDNLLKSGCNIRDIQVISPVSTDKYEWGTQKMNAYLQSLYNYRQADQTLRYKRFNNYTLFRVSDPVIHMENDYEMQHYNWNVDVLSPSDKGIRNGEIGYIKRIWMGEELSDYVLEKDSELYMNCRRPNAIIIEVEYNTAGDTYSIFYNCRNAMRNGDIGPEGWEVQGGNISSIQLAYAITVHKMQGSQAKHIIILWYNMRNKEFLSRNMLYTACTRAQKTVRLLCEQSVVEQARRIISSDKRTSYLKEYFKDKK